MCSEKNTYMHTHMPALAYRVNRPRGTGSVGDSVGEQVEARRCEDMSRPAKIEALQAAAAEERSAQRLDARSADTVAR